MKVDIEEAARIYFDRFLITLLDNNIYFRISDVIKGQLMIDAVTNFQKKYTSNKHPYGHNMRSATYDIIDFHIHFNYKGSEHYMNITLYPKLVERRLKLNKIIKHESRNSRRK